MNTKSLPGWTTKINEISNGVFKVTVIDSYGRKVEVTDNEIQETIDRALNNAFDIEKQISNNWNKFLYDFCLLQLPSNKIIKKSYSDKNFGSWFIEVTNKRLLYIGRGLLLVSQTQSDNKWFDNYILKGYELNYSSISLFLNSMA